MEENKAQENNFNTAGQELFDWQLSEYPYVLEIANLALNWERIYGCDPDPVTEIKTVLKQHYDNLSADMKEGGWETKEKRYWLKVCVESFKAALDEPGGLDVWDAYVECVVIA